MKNLQTLVRPNVWTMKAYSSARDEFKGSSASTIFLDANENALGAPLEHQKEFTYHRYPDPHQRLLKQKLAQLKNVQENQIFIGNGSDEAIDLLFRIFCIPQKDNVIINPPTYGMYAVSAVLNDIEVRKSQLTTEFELDLEGIYKQIDENTKLIFVCTPNNPTANSLNQDKIIELIQKFEGIVVIDEAYIDFANSPSFTTLLEQYPNIVVLQTLSKAWGLAGIRLGMAYANTEIIELYSRIKPPYNVNILTQKVALEALQNAAYTYENIKTLNQERHKLIQALQQFNFVEKVFESDTNFILVRMQQPQKVYTYLIEKNHIVVRDRSKEPLCENCLRITVGSPQENDLLIQTLNDFASIQA